MGVIHTLIIVKKIIDSIDKSGGNLIWIGNRLADADAVCSNGEALHRFLSGPNPAFK
jgi:hypothetical protein